MTQFPGVTQQSHVFGGAAESFGAWRVGAAQLFDPWCLPVILGTEVAETLPRESTDRYRENSDPRFKDLSTGWL